MQVAIETKGLTKRYFQPAGWRRLVPAQGTTAVNKVDLTVYAGELFGLLGPNGAGKTTFVKMLCTLVAPTSGTAMVAGYPLGRSGDIRTAVGLVVSDERSFYWRLSGRRNLEFFAAMYGFYGREADQRIGDVLTRVDMTADADKPFSNYSTGMKQRLAIARSLMHRPRLLFLDEPSRSLDPRATARLHDLILHLNEDEDTTIFLITHDLVEAEKLCRRVAVMHQGRIQVIGEPGNLRRELQPQQRYKIRLNALDDEVMGDLLLLAPDARQSLSGESIILTFQAGEDDGRLAAVLDCLRRNKVAIHSIEGHPPSLEEVFEHFTEIDLSMDSAEA